MPNVLPATGRNLIVSAYSRLAWTYKVDEHRLIGDTNTTDCSGYIYLAARDCGRVIPTVSWSQARWCRDNGLDHIPFDVALHTPGALMFKGENYGYDGFGAGGHVAFCLGDGVNVIEAEGTARDILIDPAFGDGAGAHPWTNAARMPGFDYRDEGDMPLNNDDLDKIEQRLRPVIQAECLVAIRDALGGYPDGKRPWKPGALAAKLRAHEGLTLPG